MEKAKLEVLENELEEVSGGMSLDDLREMALDFFNKYFILPQATIDYINTTTDEKALENLFQTTRCIMLIEIKQTKKMFEQVCRKYGIPYEGYVFLLDR